MQFPQDKGVRADVAATSAEQRPGEDVHNTFSQMDILQHLDDEVWVLDETLRFVYLNRSERQRLLGTSALDFVPASSRETFRAAAASAWKDGVAHIEMAWADWADGAYSLSRLVPLTDRHGVKHVLVSTRDITADKRAEAASSESEARLRSALDASGVGSWSWSMLTGTLVWDERMCEIWGLPATPETYPAYLETLHPEDLERVKALVERYLTVGGFEEFEHRIIRPTGEVRQVHCRAMAVIDADGTTVGMRGGVFDVTERRLLEERLRNVHRLEAVGRLTAGIAHNFNNLLGIIIPNVELCRDAPPELAKTHLDDIENAAERAAEMVRQLMQFGRHEQGAPKRAVTLQSVVSRLLHICRTTFEPRIVIECELPPEPLPILASAGEVEQVLLNVCINSRDALTTSHTDSPTIRIEVGPGSTGFMRVRISDNGPGMRSEVRSRVFEPFFTTKGVGNGTGLGLASAYGIMCDHGGTIVCDSEVGRGTSFTVEFPASLELPLEEQRKKAASVPPGSETVLIVDDELALRKVLRIILEQAGFHVVEARDGIAGIELLSTRSHEIDVIVLDRSMPRMSGEQFLREMRRLNIQLPAIILTGHGGNEVAAEGAAAVLMKPAATGELVRTIRAVLDRTRAVAQLGKLAR